MGRVLTHKLNYSLTLSRIAIAFQAPTPNADMLCLISLCVSDAHRRVTMTASAPCGAAVNTKQRLHSKIARVKMTVLSVIYSYRVKSTAAGVNFTPASLLKYRVKIMRVKEATPPYIDGWFSFYIYFIFKISI